MCTLICTDIETAQVEKFIINKENLPFIFCQIINDSGQWGVGVNIRRTMISSGISSEILKNNILMPKMFWRKLEGNLYNYNMPTDVLEVHVQWW